MRKWTEDEEKYLKETYPVNVPIEEICNKLHRTYDSVMKKAQRMLLKREIPKESPYLVNWDKVDDNSFFVKRHKSKLKDKLYTSLKGD